MTDDQLQMMIATMRGSTDSVQKMNLLRSWAGAELTKLWEKELRVVFEATREGEVAVPAHTYERVVESTELTLPKLDRVWPGTSGKAKEEVAVPTHTYEQVVESTEMTILKAGPGVARD